MFGRIKNYVINRISGCRDGSGREIHVVVLV